MRAASARCSRSCADATFATASAGSRRAPHGRRVGAVPSDLPDASQSSSMRPARARCSWPRADATSVTASGGSRRAPHGRRVEALPSDLPDASQSSSMRPARARCSWPRADATSATASGGSRRAPHGRRVGALPSDLPDVLQWSSMRAASTRCPMRCGDARTRSPGETMPCCGVRRSRHQHSVRALCPRGRSRPCTQLREEASTVAEHAHVAVRDDVSANAPGRSEGRCEHTDLAAARDIRHGVQSSRSRADATIATASAGSRRAPHGRRVGALPSDLPDVLQWSSMRAASTRCPMRCGDARTTSPGETMPCCGVRRSRHQHSVRALCPRGRSRPCTQLREEASTVAEHAHVAVRDDVSANAPGRSEGRCEHTDLAAARDIRHGVQSSRSRADATFATASAGSRRAPHGRRVGALPSDLPDASQCSSMQPASTRCSMRCGDARTTSPGETTPCCGCSTSRHQHSVRALCPRGRSRPCTQLREADEHARRARARCGLRRRLRECARQARGEVRAHRPRGRARARHPSRRPLLAVACRRDIRHGVRWLAARTTRSARRGSPLGPAGRFAVIVDAACEGTVLDEMR
jgi:hypothetical protein